jgi:hypothetical protein
MNNQRGFYKGKWYAEIYESTRNLGIQILSVHEFSTAKERDDFISEYNQILLTHGGTTPEVYTIATEPTTYVVSDFVNRGKYK